MQFTQDGIYWRLPKLFGVAKKGKVKWWEVSVWELRDGSANICTEYASGLEDTPMIADEVVALGKNIGRGNETAPLEQAMKQAMSRWRRKLDQGYSLNSDVSTATNTLDLPMPMLAYPMEKRKAFLPEMVYVQPKLDGHRAMVGWLSGKLVMWSRRGKLIPTMGHILEAAAKVYEHIEKDWILDGELYIHGKSLQSIGSYVKRSQPGSEFVQYRLYDMFHTKHDTMPFSDRLRYLDAIPLERPLFQVPTELVAPAEISEHFKKWRKEGFEGAMVRDPATVYEAGFRSYGLLKVKEFADAEFLVVGVEEGIPRTAGGVKHSIGILQCVTKEGTRFNVTAPGTVLAKDHVAKNPGDYIGKKVTVQYAYLTKDGVPFHPCAVRFRDDI